MTRLDTHPGDTIPGRGSLEHTPSPQTCGLSGTPGRAPPPSQPTSTPGESAHLFMIRPSASGHSRNTALSSLVSLRKQKSRETEKYP